MNIVHFITWLDLEKGGTVRAVLDLSDHLCRKGHCVTILSCSNRDVPGHWDQREETPDVIVLTRSWNPLRPLDSDSLRRAERVIGESDVLHLNGVWQQECRQLAGIARRLGTPQVVSTHGMLDDWCMAQRKTKKRLYHRFVLKGILEEAAAVHCTAQAEFDQSKKWFPPSRGVVIPLLFDMESMRQLPGPDPAKKAFPEVFVGRPLLLFLSRLHVKKGIERLIEAAKILSSQGIDYQLAIAGSGEARYVAGLKAMVTHNGLDENVKFIGFVTGVEKISLLQAAEIFVLPTSQENFGLVLTEAMACGTPVITTRGVDIWNELDQSGGAVITSLDPADIAYTITELLTDKARREHMSGVARSWVFQWLESSRVIGQYEELYRSVSP